MTNLQFEKARLPDGSRVEIAREGDTVHIRRKDGSTGQLPVDRYLHGLIVMIERNSDRGLTGLEMTQAIVMAKWNKPVIWVMVIGTVWMACSVFYMWMTLSLL